MAGRRKLYVKDSRIGELRGSLGRGTIPGDITGYGRDEQPDINPRLKWSPSGRYAVRG